MTDSRSLLSGILTAVCVGGLLSACGPRIPATITIGVASGCHDVPDPSRAIEYGPSALFIGAACAPWASFVDGPPCAGMEDMSWPACPDMSGPDADGAEAGAEAAPPGALAAAAT